MLVGNKLPIWYFINAIRYDILAIIAYALIVGMFDQYSFLRDITVPLSVTAIIGTSIALLLAFRTNQSYDRWWEGRVIWGAIVNDSRTLIRQLKNFITPLDENAKENLRDFVERQSIWCYALGTSLREIPFSPKVFMYLRDNDIDSTNITNTLLDRHSEQLQKISLEHRINQYAQVQIDTTISRLCDSMGKCERIKGTVFPHSYSALIHFLIYVFATLLPLGLDDHHIIIEVLLSIVLPLAFIAIEKTSILMQDPFENSILDIPMTRLAEKITEDLHEMIDENQPTLDPVNANKYFIM